MKTMKFLLFTCSMIFFSSNSFSQETWKTDDYGGTSAVRPVTKSLTATGDEGEYEMVTVPYLQYVENSAVSIGGKMEYDSKYMFAVSGIVGANRIEVVPIEWADDVFQEDYELRSLEEVKKFVKLNKHLPDVPSEKEIKETKLDLGEMDATLLRKIEELTLYIIEQNERIAALENEIQSLQQSE